MEIRINDKGANAYKEPDQHQHLLIKRSVDKGVIVYEIKTSEYPRISKIFHEIISIFRPVEYFHGTQALEKIRATPMVHHALLTKIQPSLYKAFETIEKPVIEEKKEPVIEKPIVIEETKEEPIIEEKKDSVSDIRDPEIDEAIEPIKKEVKEPIVLGTLISEQVDELPSYQIIQFFKTVGDGSCGVHALLGKVNKKGEYECNAREVREKFCNWVGEQLKKNIMPEFMDTTLLDYFNNIEKSPSSFKDDPEIQKIHSTLHGGNSQGYNQGDDKARKIAKKDWMAAPYVIDKYLANLRNPSHWLSQDELGGMAIFFDKALYILQPNWDALLFPQEKEPNQDVLKLNEEDQLKWAEQQSLEDAKKELASEKLYGYGTPIRGTENGKESVYIIYTGQNHYSRATII